MTHSKIYQDALNQDRFGLRIASRLSQASDELPYAVSERLRAARMQALSKRKVVAVRTVPSLSISGGTASLTGGDDDFKWWNLVGSAIPMIALVIGLVAINSIQSDSRTAELAEVDAALLTDDLPPSAYTDPGFAQFLKSIGEQAQ